MTVGLPHAHLRAVFPNQLSVVSGRMKISFGDDTIFVFLDFVIPVLRCGQSGIGQTSTPKEILPVYARLLVYELAIAIASQMIRPTLRIQRKRGRPLQRRSTHLPPFRVMKIKRLLRLVAWDIRTSNQRNNRPLPVRVLESCAP